MDIFSNIINEGKNEYLKKYSSEPDVAAIVDRFWAIRQRLHAPKNDINWWITKPYTEFKQFVSDFDMKSRSERKQNTYIDIAKKYGAKLLGMVGFYEVWYIPSHEAAEQIGRKYKGISAKWCISTENSDYFDNAYSEYEFVFMVLTDGQPKINYCQKLALQIYVNQSDCNLAGVWDMADHNIMETDEFEKSQLSDMTEEACRLFQQSGLSRDRYQQESIEKFTNDTDWIKTKLFDNDPTLSVDGNQYTITCGIDILDEIFDNCGRCDIDVDTVKQFLVYDFYESINPPDEPSFEYMHKVEKAFNDIVKPYGIEWNMLERIYTGNDVESIDGRIYDWIYNNLNDDFYDDMNYYSCWYDCYIDGTGIDARQSILDQLKEQTCIIDCKFFEKYDEYRLIYQFTKSQIKDMVKFYVKGEHREPAILSQLDEYGDLCEISIQEPYCGWNGFNEEMMIKAAVQFAKRLVGYITMQKDHPGQMYFDFDNPDNPDNI